MYRGIGDYESRKELVGYRVIVDVVVIVENRTFELMRESSDGVKAEDRSRAGAELNQSPKYRLIVDSGLK